jgi:hypothetical protein
LLRLPAMYGRTSPLAAQSVIGESICTPLTEAVHPNPLDQLTKYETTNVWHSNDYPVAFDIDLDVLPDSLDLTTELVHQSKVGLFFFTLVLPIIQKIFV